MKSYCATLAGFTQNLKFANGKRLQLRLEKREEPVNESVTLVVVGVEGVETWRNIYMLCMS